MQQKKDLIQLCVLLLFADVEEKVIFRLLYLHSQLVLQTYVCVYMCGFGIHDRHLTVEITLTAEIC